MYDTPSVGCIMYDTPSVRSAPVNYHYYTGPELHASESRDIDEVVRALSLHDLAQNVLHCRCPTAPAGLGKDRLYA